MDKSPSILRATLIGGAVFGVLGGIPIIKVLNCACCALIVGGGFLAAFLYSKDCARAGAGFKPGDGALVGLVAGLFNALATSVVGEAFKSIMDPPDIDQSLQDLEQVLEQLNFNFPPEALEQAAVWMERSGGVMGAILGFFFTLLLAAVFSTLGGLIGGAVFKVEPRPPAGPFTGSTGSMDLPGPSLEPRDPGTL